MPDAPNLNSQPLPRPRVDGLLDVALQNPLAVMNAGAGLGKTTAATLCLAERADTRAVWFSFVAPDNNPARFWAHLCSAFAHHRPSLAEGMRVLGFPETAKQFGSFAALLTEELYHDALRVVFVFDDMQRLEEPAVAAFFVNLLAARMENSALLLLTRRWPLFDGPLPVVPQMIGGADLRFTQAETAAYLAALGLSHSEAAVSKINRYISGWPVALSLVVLSMRHGEADRLDDTALSAGRPALYALFEREIFSQYTPAEQQLLIKLSALDSFPRGLVQAVSGEGHRDLSALLDANLFIRYSAEKNRLYFSALYLDFLRDKRLGIDRAELAETYRAAGDWCRENGHTYDAMNYYREAGDHAALWEAMQHIDATRHTKSEAEFFIGEIDALPEDFKATHPMTLILRSTMLINNLRLKEAESDLQRSQSLLDAAPQDEQTPLLLGELFIARGFLTLALEQNGFEVHFEKADELLPLGSRRWNNKLQLVDLGPGLNLQSARAGALKKSLACFEQATPHMARVLHGAGSGLDKLCRCEALFLTGEVRKALDPGYQALYEAQAAAQYDICGNALFMLMRIYSVQGDYAKILDTIEHVDRYEQDPESQNLGIWDILRGWYYSEVDEVEKVARWIRNPVQKGFAPLSIDRAMLVRLRCLVAAGQYAEALALLEPFTTLARGKQAVILLLYLEIGRAVIHSYLGNHSEAMASLKTAYQLARGNKLYMPFIEYGNRTRTLLDRARQTTGHGIPADWLDEMHAKASTQAKRNATLAGRYRRERAGHTTDFALSRREAELLQNLSQGLTREEMAAEMDLSINTVKSVTKQLFAKLGAINAADAVRIGFVNQLI